MADSKPVLLLALDPQELTDDHMTQLQHSAPNHEVIVTNDHETIARCAPRVAIVSGNIPHDALRDMPNLRWFQQWGAGADWLLRYPDLRERPFTVTNASGVHAVQITEHIFALLLAFARGLPYAMRTQQAHTWQSPGFYDVFELADKTMLLIGVGAIGSRTALVAEALGMNVIGMRRTPAEPQPGVQRMVTPDQLQIVLPQADFVVLTIPWTTETGAFLGPEEFAVVKEGAYLVNIGRGRTIDEEAMLNALRSGRLAGAGLDVFAQEPLPADSPFWDMENVIVTCHYAGNSPRYTERAIRIFLDNLRRYNEGVTLHNLVDKNIGY